jgi:general stress protein YciG
MDPKKRGFAVMDMETRRRISSLGGKEAHRRGTAHEWTPQEARLAGQKGGKASQRVRSERRA